MAVLRKVALGLLLVASAAVLMIAALELWNYRQWAPASAHEPIFNQNDSPRILQERIELLSNRVGDFELLVLILLGVSGLYSIVFVASSYATGKGFSRQADQTIRQVQDQIGLAMGDLRELQERTEQSLKAMPNPTWTSGAAAPQQQVADLAARLARRQSHSLGEESKLELLRDESAAAHLEVIAGPELRPALAAIYLGFARIYATPDAARARHYLERALALAPAQSPLASEIHFELACRLAASREFDRAIGELTVAFEHQFLAIEERLAGEIDEGGQLYELASTPPFDKAVNDLLLNMNIGIG